MFDETETGGEFRSETTTSTRLDVLQAELRDARGLAFRQAVELQALGEQLLGMTERMQGSLSTALEFASRISHEVRSPLSAILGYVELLLETAADKAPGIPVDSFRTEPEASIPARVAAVSDAVECLETLESPQSFAPALDRVPGSRSSPTIPWLRIIQRNSQQLLTAVEDLVELVRLEAGRDEVAVDCLSPTLEMYDVVELLGSRAHQKGLSIEVRYLGPIPERIRTDRAKLRRILINLIGNAIKYTDRGRIGIAVSMEGSPWDENPRLAISVEDTGVGISREWQSHLFHSPLAPTRGGTRRSAGTGLGLAVSWQLARLLSGDLMVDSELGRGSRFRVTIGTGPLDGVRMIGHLAADCDDEFAPPARVEPTTVSRLCARVLVVEDGIDNQRLLKMILGRAGATVEIAENGRVGVDRALAALSEGQPFDLVLMDIQMPVLDGYEATRKMRLHGVSQPILALTAHAMAGDRDRCLEAGCDDYLTKPVDRDVLLQTLGRWLDEARRVRVVA
jgi:signal transduction histidine kinase/ActR/RegA family two-component response regulator